MKFKIEELSNPAQLAERLQQEADQNPNVVAYQHYSVKAHLQRLHKAVGPMQALVDVYKRMQEEHGLPDLTADTYRQLLAAALTPVDLWKSVTDRPEINGVTLTWEAVPKPDLGYFTDAIAKAEATSDRGSFTITKGKLSLTDSAVQSVFRGNVTEATTDEQKAVLRDVKTLNEVMARLRKAGVQINLAGVGVTLIDESQALAQAAHAH